MMRLALLRNPLDAPGGLTGWIRREEGDTSSRPTLTTSCTWGLSSSFVQWMLGHLIPRARLGAGSRVIDAPARASATVRPVFSLGSPRSAQQGTQHDLDARGTEKGTASPVARSTTTFSYLGADNPALARLASVMQFRPVDRRCRSARVGVSARIRSSKSRYVSQGVSCRNTSARRRPTGRRLAPDGRCQRVDPREGRQTRTAAKAARGRPCSHCRALLSGNGRPRLGSHGRRLLRCGREPSARRGSCTAPARAGRHSVRPDAGGRRSRMRNRDLASGPRRAISTRRGDRLLARDAGPCPRGCRHRRVRFHRGTWRIFVRSTGDSKWRWR